MKRLLLVTTAPPAPGHGAGERTLSIYNALRELGDVDVLLVVPPAIDVAPAVGQTVVRVPPVTARLTRWYFRRQSYLMTGLRLNPDVHTAARRLHRKYRYAAFFGRYSTPILAGCGLLGPSFIDIDDMPLDTWSSRLPLLARGFDKIRESTFQRALARFKTTFVTKRADLARVRHPDCRILPCISTRPEGVGPLPRAPTSARMLFVGGLGWSPNRDGVMNFIRRCLPSIRHQVPTAVLRVVGQRGKELAGTEGVSSDDYVADLVAEYQEASLVICPIRTGAGSVVKLAEAAGFGRAIVATTFAARGYEGVLEPGSHLLVGTSDEELVAHCVAVLRDGHLRERLALAAREAAMARLSQAAITRAVTAAVAPWTV